MLKVDKSTKNSLIVDSIMDNTWEVDLLTGESNITQSFIKILGYDKFDVCEGINSWLSLIHPEDIEETMIAFQKVIDDESDYFKSQYRLRQKDGSYMWMKSKGKALKDDRGRNIYIAGIHVYIRPYIKHEEIEQKYKNLFDNTNDIVMISEILEDGSQGKFIEVNNAAIIRLGYSKEELLNMTFKDIYTSGRFLLKKDKTSVPVEIRTSVVTIENKLSNFYIIRDISKKLKMEETIMEITEINSRVIDLSPLGIYIVKNGRIIYANKPGIRILGAEEENDLIGKSKLDFIERNSILDSKNDKLMKYINGKIFGTVEAELLKVDGAKFIGEVYSVPLTNKEELLELNYITDVTEKKNMEKINAELLRQAIEYDKLKTEFFSNISHELRTPLNIIMSALQLLTSIYESSKENTEEFPKCFKKYAGIMKQNAYRLLRLINNIIDITKIDTGFSDINIRNYNIVEIVEGITDSVADYIKSKDIDIIFDTDLEERIIACDEEKIERIILNLLSNAVKYTGSAGTINVDIKNLSSSVMIIVKDTGVGIPEDKLEVIFERFRQVDELLTRRAEGSGIGLSLVKSLVEVQGGTINVKSIEGQGSEFTIILPANILENTNPAYSSLNSILEKEKVQKKVERIKIEFSDIYK